MLFLKNYTLNYTFSSKKFISFIQGTLTLCQLYILQSVLLKKYKNLHLASWNLKQKWIKIMNRFFLLAFELWNTYFLSDLCRIQQFFNSTHSIELILSYLKLNQDFFFFSFTVWTFFPILRIWQRSILLEILDPDTLIPFYSRKSNTYWWQFYKSKCSGKFFSIFML